MERWQAVMIFFQLPACLAIIAGMLFVHDRIIRHICQRDGWNYPTLWFLRPSWMLGIGFWTWLEAAKSAGYLRTELTLFVLSLCVVFAPFVLMHSGWFTSR